MSPFSEITLLENLFTIVIGFDKKGGISFLSKLAEEKIGEGLAGNIDNLITFIKPQKALYEVQGSDMCFPESYINELILMEFNFSRYPVRAQLIKSISQENFYYIVGTPWLNKLTDSEKEYEFTLEDLPVYDSQIDLLIVLEDRENQLKELKKLGEELEVSRINEQLANKSKSNLLAMLSHEMKTPLTSVIGALSLLEKLEFKPEDEKLIDIIKTSSKNILTLINEISSFSKVELGDIQINLEVFSLQDLADEIKLMLGSKSRNNRVPVIWHIETSPSLFYSADKEKIKQILQNLIVNSLKFTKKGAINIYINEKISSETRKLLISVEDTGVGLSNSAMEKVFDPFWVDNDTRNYNPAGVGFGLYICKQLTELLGGQIGVTSMLGFGSTFSLELPVQLANMESVNIKFEDEAKEEVDFIEQVLGKRILLVEDNDSSRKIVELMLTNIGLDVTSCINGDDAVNVFKKHNFDLVLMDLNMPVMDGFKATEIIRQKYSSSQLPILAFSAFTELEDINLLYAAGFSGALQKPVSSTGLISQLKRFLLPNEAPEPGISSFNENIINDYKNIPLLDQTVIDQLIVDTGHNTYRQLIEGFKVELAEKSVLLKKTYKDRSLEELRKEAHSLKGVCLYYGALSLADLLNKIEILASEADSHAFIMVPHAQELIKNTLQAISSKSLFQIV